MELDYFSPYLQINFTLVKSKVQCQQIISRSQEFQILFFFEELRWTNTNKSYLCNRIKLKVESEKGSIKVHIF